MEKRVNKVPKRLSERNLKDYANPRKENWLIAARNVKECCAENAR